MQHLNRVLGCERSQHTNTNKKHIFLHHTMTRQEILPGKCGWHFEQDGLPLLSLMELPNSSSSILTSAHKPEAPSDHSQDDYHDNFLPNKEWFDLTFPLSGKTGCCPLCPIYRTEVWRADIRRWCIDERVTMNPEPPEGVLRGSYRVLVEFWDLLWTTTSQIIYSNDIVCTSCGQKHST